MLEAETSAFSSFFFVFWERRVEGGRHIAWLFGGGSDEIVSQFGSRSLVGTLSVSRGCIDSRPTLCRYEAGLQGLINSLLSGAPN